MKEDEQALGALKTLTDEAKTLIRTFYTRAGTLYDHKKTVREIMSLLLAYKTDPDEAIKQKILSNLEKIKKELLQPFVELHPELAQATQQEFEKSAQHEIHDIQQLEQDLQNEVTAPKARERIQAIIKGLKQEIENKRENVKLLEHVKELTWLARGFYIKEKELLKQEVELIKKTENVLELRNPNEYDSLAFNWRSFLQDFERVLRQEKTEVIDHFGPMFKEEHGPVSLAKKLLSPFSWIREKRKPTADELRAVTEGQKITAEDIIKDISTFTSAGELQRYQSYLMRHLDLLDERARNLLTRAGLMAGTSSAQKEAKLSNLAYVDPLTGLYRRAAFDERLESELQRAFQDQTKKVSVLFMDIDHFKTFNDTYGHAVGDQVLAFVGVVIKNTIRPGDVACRWGGEELVVLLPATDKAGAVDVAERIRLAVQNQSKTLMSRVNSSMATELSGKVPRLFITLSIGVATYPDDAKEPSIDAIKEIADKRVYAAKSKGRNCTVAN